MRLLLMLMIAFPAYAQIQVQAGASSFMGTGGGVVIYAPNSETSASGGVYGGKAYYSISERFMLDKFDVVVGDRFFSLTSGQMGLSVPVRGLSAILRNSKGELDVFVGAAGDAFMSPYFSGIKHTQLGGGFSYKRAITKSFMLGTIQASVVGKVTSLGEAEYQWRSFRFRTEDGLMQGNASYNYDALFASRHFGADLSQATFLYTQEPGQPVLLIDRTTYESVSANSQFGVWSGNASIFHSTQNMGESFGTGLNFRPFSVSGNYFTSKGQRIALLTLTERSLHWGLTQYISRTDLRGQSNIGVNFGGYYTSNAWTAQIGYSEQYYPLLAQPFLKTLTASLSIHFHALSVNAQTITTPGGKLTWATYGNDYLQQRVPIPAIGNGQLSGAHITQSGHSGKYIIQGVVVDDKGVPVSGAAILVGKSDEVYTDSQGQFSVREKHAENTIKVDCDGFMAGGQWDVVSAPSTGKPGSVVKIIVRRKT